MNDQLRTTNLSREALVEALSDFEPLPASDIAEIQNAVNIAIRQAHEEIEAVMASHRKIAEAESAAANRLEWRNVRNVLAIAGVLILAALLTLWGVPAWADGATTQASESHPTWFEIWTPEKVASLIGTLLAAYATFRALRADKNAITANTNAKEARAATIRNFDRILTVQDTASEAKGIARSASGTADKALAQTPPSPQSPSLEAIAKAQEQQT